MPKPIALAFSDLHLSLQAPACRADKDWLAVQANYLDQIKQLAESFPVPILFAGDLFDKPYPTPELINFALRELPDNMICVPGQHDLPNHRMDEMHRSGYGVLKEAGKIISLDHTFYAAKAFTVYGFGWGKDLVPAPNRSELQIALIHQYMWIAGDKYLTAHPEALKEARVDNHKKVLGTYDIAIVGDNHKSWYMNLGKCLVVNCGCVIRRKSDEIPRKPKVYLLYDDGTMDQKHLDIHNDVFHENAKEREETALDLRGFIDGMEALGEQGLNFVATVENQIRNGTLTKVVIRIILEALGNE